jgi:hypothetical protein
MSTTTITPSTTTGANQKAMISKILVAGKQVSLADIG